MLLAQLLQPRFPLAELAAQRGFARCRRGLLQLQPFAQFARLRRGLLQLRLQPRDTFELALQPLLHVAQAVGQLHHAGRKDRRGKHVRAGLGFARKLPGKRVVQRGQLVSGVEIHFLTGMLLQTHGDEPAGVRRTSLARDGPGGEKGRDYVGRKSPPSAASSRVARSAASASSCPSWMERRTAAPRAWTSCWAMAWPSPRATRSKVRMRMESRKSPSMFTPASRGVVPGAGSVSPQPGRSGAYTERSYPSTCSSGTNTRPVSPLPCTHTTGVSSSKPP